MQELLDKTGAGRVTLRLDEPDEVFPVKAEALAPGVRPIKGDTSIDLRKIATYKWIKRELRPLIQTDCANEDPAPPRELVEHYGVGAQMLGPIVRNGELGGIISVHHVGGSREWKPEEVAALEDAVRRVTAALEQGQDD